MAINALRLRTTDPKDAQGRFRYLRAVNGGGFGLLATRLESPGQWETFLFEEIPSVPLTNGTMLSMNLCDQSWNKSGMLVRVQHGVRTFPPRNRKDPPLVTYEVGGPEQAIWVVSNFSAGYPAYPGDDPAERVFDLIKQDGTPIVNGDQVSLRINSNLGSTFFFRVAGPQDEAFMYGDGVAAFLADTTFVVELVEVQSGFGPCGGVRGKVTRAAGGQPVQAATVIALGVPGNRAYGATSDSSGDYALANMTDGACIPIGSIRVQASADRFQTKTVDPVVVPEGASVTQNIQLDCTIVRIKLVDIAGQPIIGKGVWLLDGNGNQVLDLNSMPYDTNTGFDGFAAFRCVPHGSVTVETDADSTVRLTVNVPPEGAERTIVIQSTCGNIVGQVVTDPVTRTGVPGAVVRVLNTALSTTTDAAGNFSFQCVRPAGQYTVRGTDPGCGAASATVNVPASGDSQRAVIVLNCSAVIVDSIVVILQWSMQPTDLDAHLSGPDGQGGRFHVFFVNRGNSPVPYASLDRDDRDGQGPEILTITRSGNAYFAGDYHVWVHNYIGSSFSGSNATVTVVRVNQQGIPAQLSRQEVQFATGSQEDDIWHVLNLAVTATGGVTVTVVQSLIPGNSNTMP